MTKPLPGQPAMNLSASAKARDEGIETVESHTSEDFKTAAYEAVVACAEDNETFTSDDVWAYFEVDYPRPSHNRALGGPVRKAHNAGVMMPTNRYTNTTQVKSHRGLRGVWRSLVWRPGGG